VCGRWMRALRASTRLFALCVVASALACRPRLPPAPPPPPPVAKPEPPPAPPPPPKCESLEESCHAAAGTELDVPGSNLRFTPPEGWTYAGESALAVTVAPDGLATLGLLAAASGERDPIIEAVEKLLTRLEVANVNLKSLRGRLGKADAKLEGSALGIELWEVDKRRQRGKAPQLKDKGPGTLLVAVAHAADGKVVVGAGFVVTPDAQSLAGLVMKSLQSLRTAP
jgi:hypothetical protein